MGTKHPFLSETAPGQIRRSRAPRSRLCGVNYPSPASPSVSGCSSFPGPRFSGPSLPQHPGPDSSLARSPSVHPPECLSSTYLEPVCVAPDCLTDSGPEL